jgi:hypothetical protein
VKSAPQYAQQAFAQARHPIPERKGIALAVSLKDAARVSQMAENVLPSLPVWRETDERRTGE